MAYASIEDYGVIGNMRTAALVGKPLAVRKPSDGLSYGNELGRATNGLITRTPFKS